MRDLAGFQRAHVRPGHVRPPGLEPPEQQADVTRFDRDTLRRLLALGHAPPGVVDDPVDERADRVGERGLDRALVDGAPLPVRGGNGERDDSWLIARVISVSYNFV